MGKHNRSLKVAVHGPALWPTPYTYIHTYLFTDLWAAALKCAGAPSCMKCSSQRLIREWHINQEIRHVVFQESFVIPPCKPVWKYVGSE
jgi:hypothetical protein